MRAAWLLALCAACGVEVVELAPDVLVLGDVPHESIARFAGKAKLDPKMLVLRYPLEGVALPANVAPIRFAWDGKAEAYELTLQTDERTLRVYTRESSVTLPAERWSAMLEGAELRVELSALDAKSMLRRGEPRTIAIRPALPGTFFLASGEEGERARVSDQGASAADLERARGAAFGDRVARVDAGALVVGDRTLPVPAGARIAHPSWTPDGDAILFTYWAPDVTTEEGSVLAELTLDGAFTQLAIDGVMNPRRPRVAPDGRIAFEAGKLDDPELFVVAREGGMARRVMCGGGKEGARAPAWVTGSWLAFVSTRPYLDPPRAQVWLAELADDLRCSAPFWLPAQQARDYDALWFERE